MTDTTDTNPTDMTMTADTDTDTVTLVTTDVAAHLVGVSARTVRRWIQHGSLPAGAGANSQLVSPADLPAAKRAAGHRRGHDHGHGHRRTDTATDSVTNADTSAMAVSPAARSQLEAIRDEWLQPLVDRLGDAERNIGRLEQERDQLRAEVDRLHRERDASPEGSAGSGEAEGTKVGHESWWRRVLPEWLHDRDD
jgi:DNA-binding transcriptional MerR regulator